ncbi:hypothetical protein MSAN_00617000 [Mycena sanguinolenta]|uniref:Uncharacterized protein n=1 Tax=Mycena sanguinolenta TaxID=230812 RepID=A0A8H6Z0E7_9AGAR|nr:hypothetical protein MSAN_00617000 [Mycena sanguinolenta]
MGGHMLQFRSSPKLWLEIPKMLQKPSSDWPSSRFRSCLSPAIYARYPSYGTLRTKQSGVNNTYSTINLSDMYVQSDMANLIERLQANDTDIRVVVFTSGNKDFFIGHIDVDYFLPGYESVLPLYIPGYPDMLFPVALLWKITQLPQTTIAVIEGRPRGIGNEFLMSSKPLSAPTPAQYLSRLIDRARLRIRALLRGRRCARTAARANDAFDTSHELHEFVNTLAAEDRAVPPAAGIVGTKAGINAVMRPPPEVIVRQAQNVIAALIGTPAVQGASGRFVQATDNQSIGPVELNHGAELVTFFT